MDEPYRRPDRAAIAARIAAEETGRDGRPVPVQAFMVGGTGPDPLAVRELAEDDPLPAHPEPGGQLPAAPPDVDDQARDDPPPPRRCPRCHYHVNTIGHKTTCGTP
jgi:hypothetical protein